MFSDTDTALKALKSLDLLVVNDLFLSATARHADYVVPVTHPFERVDIPMLSDAYFAFAFNQYAYKVVTKQDDVIEEWEMFWRVAQVMGTGFTPPGIPAGELPEVYCTTGNNLPSLRRRRQYNPALMNPADMARLGLCDGDPVVIASGQEPAVAASLRTH